MTKLVLGQNWRILVQMLRPVVALAFLLLTALSFGQTTSGSKSLIPKDRLNAVKKTKFRVLVPTYIPKGFQLKSASLKLDKEPILVDWLVAYVHPKTKATITLQMASEGLGDPIFDLPNGDIAEPNGSLWAKSPIMGKVEVMWVKKGKYKSAACTWYDASKKTYPRFAMVMSDGVDAAEIKKVIENLRWLAK